MNSEKTKKSKVTLTIAFLGAGVLSAACTNGTLGDDEPAGELILHRADGQGISGEYRAEEGTIFFETLPITVADAQAEPFIAARITDQDGTVLAISYLGEELPPEWADSVLESDDTESEVLPVYGLMPAVADALADAQLSEDMEPHRLALVDTIGVEGTEGPGPEDSPTVSGYIGFSAYCWAWEGVHVTLWNPTPYTRHTYTTFYYGNGQSMVYRKVWPYSSSSIGMSGYYMNGAWVDGHVLAWGSSWCLSG